MSEIFIVLLVVAIVILLAKAKFEDHASYQGKIGESEVSYILHKLPEEYLIINNVIIPTQQGTTQIDHIVVSPYGIFVIETKNYKGWIFGAEKSEKWKETFKTTEASYFRNPIKQNWSHIYALSEYLNVNKSVFRPLVVFSNDAKLNVETTTPVIYMSQLIDYIGCFQQEIIPVQDASVLYDRLCKTNLLLVDKDIEEKHIQSVKNKVAKQEQAIRNGICPKCGGKLILRNGKYGQFYGCSNYPNCKFTYNIKQ